MASCLPHPSTLLAISHKTSHLKNPPKRIALSLIQNNRTHFNSNPFSTNQTHCSFRLNSSCTATKSSNGFLENLEISEEDESSPPIEGSPVKFLLWVFLWASVSVAVYAFSPGDAKAEAAAKSIKASRFGVKFASFLRGSGWSDEAVVFALATLPVIELRGAIPVGYWLQLRPLLVTVLAVLGNMVPVPFILLYLKPLATFLAGANEPASRFLDVMFERAKRKARPVEEFQWAGLMLFVAVPFPGTGAWTGAFIASILDIPFWAAVSANFCGVVLAAVLVNMLVNLGLWYAVLAAVVMFTASGFMWSVLRGVKRCFNSSS